MVLADLSGRVSQFMYSRVVATLPDEMVAAVDSLDALGDDGGAWSTFVSLVPSFAGRPEELASLCAGFASASPCVLAQEDGRVKGLRSLPMSSQSDLLFCLPALFPGRWPNIERAAWCFASPPVQLLLAATSSMSAASHERCRLFCSAVFRAAYLSGLADADAGEALWAEDTRRAVVAGREAGRRLRERLSRFDAGSVSAPTPGLVVSTTGTTWVRDDLVVCPDGVRIGVNSSSFLPAHSVAALLCAPVSFTSGSDRVFSRTQWQRLLPDVAAALCSRDTPADVREAASLLLRHACSVTYGRR